MTHSPKIAWLSPFPPQKSGIANYSHAVINELKHHLDIDLYYDQEAPSDEIKRDFSVYPISTFAERRGNYDEVVYHLGNHSGFHKNIYQLAWDFPATIVLHDYNLSGFLREAFYKQGEWQLYQQAIGDGNGESLLKGLHELIPKFGFNVATSPMSQAVVNRSKKVIVHHRWVKNQFRNSDHIHVVPHFAKVNYQPSAEEIYSFKRKFLIKESDFLISCLGFTNRNKLPQLQIDLVSRLLDRGYPVHLLFAGETAPDVKHLQSEVDAGKNRENITFTGYLDERDYFNAIFASDLVINLRNPSMGEASGTLMHTLAAGKPAIVSDLDQYKEFPDSVCWKVTHDVSEVELLYEYVVALLSNKNLRSAMSANAVEYVKSVLALDRVIPQWLRVIHL